jgi:hypothetical protein
MTTAAQHSRRRPQRHAAPPTPAPAGDGTTETLSGPLGPEPGECAVGLLAPQCWHGCDAHGWQWSPTPLAVQVGLADTGEEDSS